jgi:hypothetical protein
MEAGTVSALDNLETVRHAVNGQRVVLFLRQAGDAGLSASWASQLFVPLIGHLEKTKIDGICFCVRS